MMPLRYEDGLHVAGMLAYVTRLVKQQLLVQNEQLTVENGMLRAHLPAHPPLSGARHPG